MPSLDELAKTPQNINEWFLSICAHVAESRRVIEELSKEDPPTEPFKSKYAGRNMLKSALQRAQSFQPSTDQETSRIRCAQATIFLYIGQVSVDVEEPKEAEKNFQSCLDILGLETTNKYNISLLLHAHNLLAAVWSGRGDHDKAYQLLEKAKELHAGYLHSKLPAPKSYDEIFMDEFSSEERNVMFEKLYTNTLFYLAQVFGVRGDNKQAAAHCHITLQRQLEAEDFDPLDWSLNCATLSQYYVTMNNYQSARHTLACASSVISNVQESSENSTYSDESYDNEKIVKTRADIERCWIKFCVNLLKDSVSDLEASDLSEKVSKITEMKNNFEDEEDKEDSDKKDEGKEEDKKEEEKVEDLEAGEKKEEETQKQDEEDEQKKRKTFSDLVDVEDIELLRITNVESGQYEELVPGELCKTYEDARKVFKAGSKFVENAIKYYTFDGFVTDYVEIKQDLSGLYKNLAVFDKDESRKCKMHKRRVDTLTELVTPLNIQHFRQICRQLRFELGEVKNTMVSLKYSIAVELPQEQQNWKKINNLCFGAIQEFENFCDLLRDPNDKFPDTLSDETVRPYVISQIFIARLYGKFRPMDTSQKLSFLAKAETHFKKALDYYDSHLKQCSGMDLKEEVDVAREMLHFLPRKMEKIRQAAA
ncbi:hypothetical protein ACHWQZ_G006193 [Mnemiopsis leidyi]